MPESSDTLKQTFLSFALTLLEDLLDFGSDFGVSPEDLEQLIAAARTGVAARGDATVVFAQGLPDDLMNRAMAFRQSLHDPKAQDARRMAQILDAWHSDSKYGAGFYGAPSRLPLQSAEDDKPSLESLVREYGDGLTLSEAYKMLLDANKIMVLEEEGLVAPLTRDAVDVGDAEDRLIACCTLAQRALQTAIANARTENPEKRLMHRYVSSSGRGLDAAAVELFSSLCKEKSYELLLQFLEKLNELGEIKPGEHHTGATIFQFVD